MKPIFKDKNILWSGLIIIILILQLATAFYFCSQKSGYHYDEYYSYYSSNKTYGLIPTDREWKPAEEIRSEFVVRENERWQFGLVKQMQGFDVHPPLYYYLLHGVCSLFSGLFSKWLGLGINLVLFTIGYFLLAKIGNLIFKKDKKQTLLLCLLYGFQPGVLSGITFIRMYVLLTLWCLAVTLWHREFWEKGLIFTGKKVITLFLLVFLGFMTHYYFLVFLFFLCAFTCLVEWWGRKNLKGSIFYGIIVCSSLLLGIAYYPASLRHIFRGYRGTEATGAFFDFSNTMDRLGFFAELMNQSVFGGSLIILLLLLLLMAITYGYGRKKREKEKNLWKEYLGFFHILTATAGYFFVVAKTALLNAEEANRYELPVYGFCMLLVLGLFSFLIKECWKFFGRKKEGERITIEKAVTGILGVVAVLILGFQLHALKQGEVQFLYPADKENVLWAAENKEKTIIYCYNPNNEWMIWDEAEVLMQYDRIYFINLRNEEPIDTEIFSKEEEIYVYTSRMEEAQQIMDQILEANSSLQKKEKVRELLYCDLYRLN